MHALFSAKLWTKSTSRTIVLSKNGYDNVAGSIGLRAYPISLLGMIVVSMVLLLVAHMLPMVEEGPR